LLSGGAVIRLHTKEELRGSRSPKLSREPLFSTCIINVLQAVPPKLERSRMVVGPANPLRIQRFTMTTHNDRNDTSKHITDPFRGPSFRNRHAENTAYLDSLRLQLTSKAYDLLLLLVENVGEVIPREVLLRRVWGLGIGIRTRTLDIHIRRLRKHFRSYSKGYIETIFGVGYRFQPRHTVQRFQTHTPVPKIALTA
jgi:DNA-binding winged helix-turn-helix (wHTH) protein